jgi:hypothetical protein
MPDVMAHARWLKYTDGGFTSIRSSQLKAIDAALLRWHQSQTPANLDALRGAVVAWISKEGPAWKSSKRNKFHAVEDLHAQVMDLPVPKRTGEAMVALSYVRDESRAIVTDLFRGKRLEWRKTFGEKLGQQKWTFRLAVGGGVRSADQLSGGAIRHAPGQAASALRARWGSAAAVASAAAAAVARCRWRRI